MSASPSTPWMIVSADRTSVAGAIEVPTSASAPPSLDPDPGDTVRLPTAQSSSRLPVVG